jgi:hypothetical protein
MESATIIFFATLVHFQGGCEKEYSLYACDNDEKDGILYSPNFQLKIDLFSVCHETSNFEAKQNENCMAL